MKARIKIHGPKAKTPKKDRVPGTFLTVEDHNHTFANCDLRGITPSALAEQLRDLADLVEQCGLRG